MIEVPVYMAAVLVVMRVSLSLALSLPPSLSLSLSLPPSLSLSLSLSFSVWGTMVTEIGEVFVKRKERSTTDERTLHDV